MGPQVQVDLIHAGFHKTGSTWMQHHGFRRHPHICYLNDPDSQVAEFFVKRFVEAGDFHFESGEFVRELRALLEIGAPAGDKKIKCLSEENLIGHYWTGEGGEKLALRIHALFGRPKIVLLIRNQLDYVISCYSNYLKHGGVASISGLLNDRNFGGGRIVTKLCYHKTIEFYGAVFGQENLLVLCYEDFAVDPESTMNRIFGFVGLDPISFPSEVKNKRVNAKHSVPSEMLLRSLNLFGAAYKSRPVRGALKALDLTPVGFLHRSRAAARKMLGPSALGAWGQSNRIMADYCQRDLSALDYPLS